MDGANLQTRFDLAELVKSKHQRMLRMARQNCSSYTVVTPEKFPIFHGTRLTDGWLLVLLKTIFFKYGRWESTSTMMMNSKNKNPAKLLNLTTVIYVGYI